MSDTPALAHMCATMDWSNPDKASAFAKFKRRCQHLFQSYYKKIADDEKVIYILLWLGDEGDEIFQSFTWSNTETDSNDPEKVFEKFETYFIPVTTHRLFRYQLMNMKQGSQPVDAFVTDMKTVAMKCKFRDTEETEDRMLDQLIWGCTLQEAQKLLIGKDSKLKLDEAVNLIRTHEATRQQMESLNTITPTSVNAVRQTQHTRRGRGGQYGNHSASGSRRENECYHCGILVIGPMSVIRNAGINHHRGERAAIVTTHRGEAEVAAEFTGVREGVAAVAEAGHGAGIETSIQQNKALKICRRTQTWTNSSTYH